MVEEVQPMASVHSDRYNLNTKPNKCKFCNIFLLIPIFQQGRRNTHMNMYQTVKVTICPSPTGTSEMVSDQLKVKIMYRCISGLCQEGQAQGDIYAVANILFG